MPNLLLNFIS